jgi:substrate import-associated zinc metallohydrolase lipoprotein
MKIKLFCIFSLIAILGFYSCEEDPISDSGIEVPQGPQTDLDKWIDDTFRAPYNINVQYKWNITEIDPSHVTVPPREELVQPFLKIVRKIWLTPYIRVAENGAEFMKDYSCRKMVLIGSGSYNQGSVTLGSAANGYLITLYTVNQFDFSKKISQPVLKRFFRTMHHEFGHILNQRKPYNPNFQKITGNYTSDWTTLNDTQARELGFISAYARSAEMEDFVEVFSFYITNTDSEWQSLINAIKSEKGREYIRLKVQSVNSYMKNTYSIDILKLREQVTTAISEVAEGNLDIENNEQ